MKRLKYQTPFFVHTLIVLSTVYIILVNLGCDISDPTLETNLIDKSVQEVPDEVDFIFHVKPILSDKCFACHGPDEQKVEAGLQLHTEEKAMSILANNSLRAIVPGDPEQSILVNRIYSTDKNEIMPPPESNLHLEEYEKEILKKWIAQGAKWKEHWAFIPPTDAKIPKAHDIQWAGAHYSGRSFDI